MLRNTCAKRSSFGDNTKQNPSGARAATLRRLSCIVGAGLVLAGVSVACGDDDMTIPNVGGSSGSAGKAGSGTGGSGGSGGSAGTSTGGSAGKGSSGSGGKATGGDAGTSSGGNGGDAGVGGSGPVVLTREQMAAGICAKFGQIGVGPISTGADAGTDAGAGDGGTTAPSCPPANDCADGILANMDTFDGFGSCMPPLVDAYFTCIASAAPISEFDCDTDNHPEYPVGVGVPTCGAAEDALFGPLANDPPCPP